MSIYAITGGAGFIGSHLADALLAEGHQVRILDDLSTGRRDNVDPACTLLTGDVADPSAVETLLEDVSACFHLAAIASVARANEHWVETHRTNQTGTVTVLEAARRRGRIPVVYASSAAVYGDVGEGPATEDLRPAPQTAYGADKLGSELHARVAFGVHAVPTLGLRFFNVYGPRQDPLSPYSGVISIFARRIAETGQVTIHGDGEQTRDFVFVADVVAHLIAAMRRLHARPGAEILNVCTGRPISILGVAHLLGELAGRAPRIEHGAARPGDIRHSRGSPERAVEALGVQARTSLADGLRRTLGHGPDGR